MDLILLRHGKAEDHHPDGDAGRRLVDQGRKQAERAARLLKSAGRLPSIVLTSPYARARETAEIFCETAGMPGPLVQGWLVCGMSSELALGEVAGFSEFESVMLVGHEPDFSLLVADLLGAAAGAVQIKKGALAGIRFMPPARGGVLKFLIPPKLSGSV